MTTPTPDDVARAEAFFKEGECVELSSDGLVVVVDFNTALLAEHFARYGEAAAKAERRRIVTMLDVTADAQFQARKQDADQHAYCGMVLANLANRIERPTP